MAEQGKNCAKCADQTNNLAKIIIFFFISLFITGSSVNGTLQYAQMRVLLNYLRKTGMYFSGRAVEIEVEQSIFIKFFMTYIQIISYALSFNINIP